jgi:hypothetical protein
MPDHPRTEPTRREFLDRVGMLSAAAIIPAGLAFAETDASTLHAIPAGEFNLSWVSHLKGITDRAVVDCLSPSRNGLQIATRYLDNCDAAYGKGKHAARVVLNLRVRAIPLALNDDAWKRFALGEEYDVKDASGAPATANPFLSLAPGMAPGEGAINDLVARRAIVLVCDFALGHLADRLAPKAGVDAAEAHRALRAAIVPRAYMVPSGIFGGIKAQNGGCGFVSGG